MVEEMASIEQNKTWSLVDRPAGHRPIGLKWVFKLKRDEHGNVVKHKARLVAKGYVQRQGIDYEEVFAPVARMESVRVLLAVAAQRGWAVHHMDVKSAFLNGELAEEVYVVQPPGFIAAGHEDKVLRLHKALYGLRQAPRAWNAKLDMSLKKLGFAKSECEPGLYTRGKLQSRLVVGIYVDDLIITGESTGEIDEFKQEMKSLFRMSDLGGLTYYLGIEPKPKLKKVGTAPKVDATEYRSMIGSLRYLMNTRPDLAFSVGYLSRFMEDPRQEHKDAVKHLLRYVAGTVDYGLVYSRNTVMPGLVGYSDSDMAGDDNDRKSTSGYIFFLDGNPVAWRHEHCSSSSCAKPNPPLLKMDNQSAIALAKNPVHHDRSKHIDTKFHFIRECMNSGAVHLMYTGTEEQLADILTKALAKPKFEGFREQIGVIKLH
ncbi:hypothetical protein U9M48_008764 [Paspalum notatum var. saurae]|uniref:Reverse transcriptase Ty1/copia-type domain-containing protein n=1 Tax=Paspalum notatum var. saurae TaxID=547442 RepID=A0AAQ3SPX7_PASNO